MQHEKGMTMLEVLLIISVISIILSISTISAVCALKNSEYFESKNEAKAINLEVLNYYSKNSEIPIKNNNVKIVLSNKTKELSEEKLRKSLSNGVDREFLSDEKVIDFALDNNFIFDIDESKINLKDSIKISDVSNYVVLYVSNEDLENLKTDALKFKKASYLKKHNGTVIKKDWVDTCTGDYFTLEIGKNRYENISESLKFEVDDKYMEIPNTDLYCKINRKNKDISDAEYNNVCPNKR